MALHRGVTRRTVVKSVAAAGVVGAAGCLGDDGGDTITIAGTSTGSSTQQAAQAIQRAANEHSDTLNIDVQVTEGWTANMYEFDGGDFSTIGVDNNSWQAALNDDEPFDDDPVDDTPMQGFLFTSLEMHWVALEGSGIESTADLREGEYTIYPIEPGFGTRLLTETVLREDGIWDANNINNEDTEDVPGAVEEGRVDALCLYGANQVELAGWCQEVDIRSGGELYLIETDDEFEQTIEDVPGASFIQQEPYPYDQDVTSELGLDDDVTHWALQGQWAFGPDVDPDAVYEMARIANEHHETIREGDPTTLEYTPEIMTEVLMDGVEIHPGMVEFYQEHDVWDDDWVEGEV